MRLYISGPMAGYQDRNRHAFDEAAHMLRSAGFEVVNPTELHGPDWPPPEAATRAERAAYLRTDLMAMLDCGGLALLDGWHRSEGANVEHQVARALGLPAEPYNTWLAAGLLAAGQGIRDEQFRDPPALIRMLTTDDARPT